MKLRDALLWLGPGLVSAIAACGPLVNDPVDGGGSNGASGSAQTGAAASGAVDQGSGASTGNATGTSDIGASGAGASGSAGSSGSSSVGASGAGTSGAGASGSSGASESGAAGSSASGSRASGSGSGSTAVDASLPPPGDAGHTASADAASQSGSSGGSCGAAGASAACPSASSMWTAGTGLSRTGWMVSASSTAPPDAMTMASNVASNAIDGDLTTRWSGGHPQMSGDTFSIDLGHVTSISQVVLYLGTDQGVANSMDAPVAYQLDLSTDNASFTTVATGSGSAPATPICFKAQCARYIKITQTGTAPVSWWSIYEISVAP